MPKYAVPKNSDDAQEVAAVFGSAVHLAIIRELRRHSPLTLGDLTRELGVGSSTVAYRVRLLESHGVIVADPPQTRRRQGAEAAICLDEDRLAQLFRQLASVVGQQTTSQQGPGANLR